MSAVAASSIDYADFIASKRPSVIASGLSDIPRLHEGMELKESYWRQACKNLASAEAGGASLFDVAAA
jgi:hypothetical protein